MKGRSHTPVILHPDRLFSSVGTCGTNAPDEVKKLQQMVSGAGYRQATGRTLKVDGQCGQSTIEAIRWYQRLLNMSPSGLVTPVDSFFIQALSNAITPHWRPKNTSGPLRVHEGQITFDAEGSDYITAVEPFRQNRYPNFTRILHWPEARSGVTLGRGYDMRERSAGEIHSTLRQAGIEEYKAVICSKAAHLKSRQAAQFVKVYGPLVGEITHQQQINLFEIAYREKRYYGIGVYNRNSRNVPNRLTWGEIESKIRDVFIDTLYMGNRTAPLMVKIMASSNNRQKIIKYIEENLLPFDHRRNLIRIRYLK
ncbi:peptidoglycan-binding protein [Erwinia mallotivora]|uniref:peptidoglycan-binding protein n=1 Tax=Erwinia mallotivora TaxID=69222 RepID=UPI0021C225C2|nr:peptidoglycan-binding protein [Erwinia mallotivora]